MLQQGTLMACPVPVRTGYLMQLCDIYNQWKSFPCDNEGTVYATFSCVYTSQTTSLAFMEQVHLVMDIAADLRLHMICLLYTSDASDDISLFPFRVSPDV